MSISMIIKGAALAATVAVSTLSLQAMAAEDGKCNTNMAINYIKAPEVTPQLVEWLRTAYSARFEFFVGQHTREHRQALVAIHQRHAQHRSATQH